MLDVLYSTPDLLVINKPSNVSILADRTGSTDLWQHLKQEFSQSNEKPFLVHRLDKGTSGVLLIARNQKSQTALTRAFSQRAVKKYYLAWVVGQVPAGTTWRINLPLCKGRKSRYRVAGPRQNIFREGLQYKVEADREGIDAVSDLRCLRHDGEHSLVLVKPITGRTHQIRVHLAWIGYPIVGDHLYGKPASPAQQAERLALHCHRLVLPGWGRFSAPWEVISDVRDLIRAPNAN